MRVAKDTVVSLDVELSDLWGNVIERSTSPVDYLHGGYGELLDAVEAALEGKEPADRLALDLEPEDAFGDYDERLLRVEDRERFPADLEVGMRFEGIPGDSPGPAADSASARAGSASAAPVVYTVTDIAAGKVVLDGNHPFAGVAIRFKCTVRNVRPATAAELARGSAENPHALRVSVPG
jgi:FKBP-type peptidyl-prolyl cis-trans isomerase SlyD